MLTSHAQLNGTYTINPGEESSEGNYQDFESAIQDIEDGIRNDGGPANGWGVSGPVVFEIADGDYEVSLSIGQINGLTLTNTLTFQSASHDSTAVRLYHTIEGRYDNVVYLNDADYIHFNQLTLEGIKSQYSSYCFTIQLSGSATYNKFTNCIIKGEATTSTSTNYSTIYFASSSVRNNEFVNNSIEEGSVGAYFNNGYNNKLENNTFTGQYSYNIYLNYGYYPQIIGNTFISSDESYSDKRAIYSSNVRDSIKIIGNKIYGDYRYGIYLYYQYSDPDTRGLVANNFISLTGTSSSDRGIYHRYSQNVDYINNSVNMNTGSSSDYAFLMDNSSSNNSNNRIINNIFSADNGYCIYIGYTPGIDTLDYNNYYTEGSNLGYWGASYSNLADWQTACGMDNNSYSINPYFASSGDLHILNKTLNGTGDTLLTELVPYDIDGELRDTSACDIGADEFDMVPDVGLSELALSSETLCTDETEVYATIFNIAEDDITSTTINWSINDVTQTAYEWTGTLISEDSITINIGSFTPSEDSITIVAYTSAPNGGDDNYTVNDSQSITKYTALTGEYTIGGTSPDYEDFNSAIYALEKSGICGSVVFNIRDGEYNESFSIYEIAGVDESNTITFQSESEDSSLVIITSGSSDIIYLNGADYITFDKLTVEQNGYGRCVRLQNESNHNNFLNCQFIGRETTSTSNSYSVIYSSTDIDSSNTFENNLVQNGSYGIYFNGAGTSSLEKGNTVENNIFENQYYHGIYMQYQDSPEIINNKISSANPHTEYAGIYLYYADNNLKIINNEIYSVYYGIYIRYCDATSENRALVGNNVVKIDNGNSNTRGIYPYSTNYIDYINNTVDITNTSSSYAFHLVNGGSNNRIKNNIFSNENGYAAFISSTTAVSEIDYNNLYNENGAFGYWGGSYTDINAWKTATGMSEHSLSLNPSFIGENNLHTNSIAFNNYGDTIPSDLAYDMDGNLRDLNSPDLGAYEYDQSGTLDIAIKSINHNGVLPFCEDTVDILATITNISLDTLTSIDINWSVDGVTQTPYNMIADLRIGEDSVATLGQITLENLAKYEIKVWLSNANTTDDDNAINDTLVSYLYGSIPAGDYTIGGTNPDFEDITEAANHLNYGGVCSGPVVFNLRDGEYNQQISLENIECESDDIKITVQSESEDNSLVTWKYMAEDEENNYVLSLSELSNFEFKNITFEASGETYFSIVSIYDTDVNKISFTDNKFIAPETTYSDDLDYNSLIYVYGSSDDVDSIEFNNNDFYGGYNAIYFRGEGTPGTTGFVFENNTVSNAVTGLYISYLDAPVISSNTFENIEYRGIYADYCDSAMQVDKNKIHLVSDIGDRIYGAHFNDCDATSGNNGYFGNNFITLEGTAEGRGMYLSNNNYLNIYHNSINIQLSDNSSRAIYLQFTYNHNIVNNIFANYSEGYALYSSNNSLSAYVDTCDYNSYYSASDYISYINGNEFSTISNWNYHASGTDTNSVIIDPMYTTTIDLAVKNHELNNAGTALTFVENDIFGTARDASTPDIGAFEFDIVNNDAALIAFNSYEEFLCDGNYEMYAVVKNVGENAITSLTINWAVNGIAQTAYNYSGSLAIGEIDTLAIGAYAMANTEDDFTTFNIEAWSSLPNGVTDAYTENDSVSIAKTSALKGGTFTINQDGSGDFISFTEAVEYLSQTNGICGSIVFDVADGTYEEYIMLPEMLGASETNTITFQSASGDSSAVILTNYDDSPYGPTKAAGPSGLGYFTVAFDGADYYSFNEMTIERTYDEGSVLIFENGATNNTVENCILKIEGEDGYVIYSGEYDELPDTENKLINNIIEGGEYGIYWYGYTDDLLDDNLIVKNNQFSNQYYGAIYAEYFNSIDIIDNQITNESDAYDYYYGIYLYNDEEEGEVNISNNSIVQITGQYGIYVDYVYGDLSNPLLISNNYISLDNSKDSGPSEIYGLYIYECSHVLVANNTINTVADMENYGIYLDYGYFTEVVNNIVSCKSAFGIPLYYYTEYITRSDYNVLYTPGEYIAYSDDYGYISTLEEWNNQTDFDQNSLSIDPEFVSDTDYHLCNALIDNAGMILDVVSTDIEGNERDATTPDIGALEFMSAVVFSLGDDIEKCPDLSVTLNPEILNGTFEWSTSETTNTIDVTDEGLYTLTVTTGCGSSSDAIQVTNVRSNIEFSLGEDIEKCPNATITLDPGFTDGTFEWSTTETTNTIDVTAEGTYSVAITTGCGFGTDTIVIAENPNTITADFSYQINDNIVLFTCTSTNANDFNWNFGDDNTGIGVNPYHQYANNGTYFVELTASNDCYDEIVTKDVILQTTGIGDITTQKIAVYPNPAKDQLFIEFGENLSTLKDIKIYDMVGVLIYNQTNEFSGKLDINLSNYSAGTYNLVIQYENKIFHKLIVIQ
ncbi:right-handed parallel beta-helix repeat-containing protein [Bacteroidota bacterium]